LTVRHRTDLKELLTLIFVQYLGWTSTLYSLTLREFSVNNSKKIALAVAMLSCAGTALAQEINPSWYVQPNVVGVKVDHDFRSDDSNWGLGLKFGKPIHPMWDIQFGGSYAGVGSSDNNYRQGLLTVDALLMLSRKNFRPYVVFGIGGQHDKVERPTGSVSKNAWNWSAGLGFQLGLTDQWNMQADLRTVRGSVDDDAWGFSRNNNKYLMVGFNYAFTKPAPPPPPPAPPEPPPPVVEAPPPPPAPPPAKFEKVTMSATELFGFNSAKLSMPQPKLDDIAAALTADPSITDVEIDGYADRLGSAKYNQKLSERRANAVRDYLVSKGIDGKRLKAVGKGQANPVVTCTNKKRADLIKCLEPNRRVEVEQISVERRVQ
jgi:OOP family OmpA-OmpF porin